MIENMYSLFKPVFERKKFVLVGEGGGTKDESRIAD
jgi:hypothetical protein